MLSMSLFDIKMQGGDANSVFIIHSGKARVTLGSGPPAQQPEARVLSAGAYFGELALLRGGERSANVIAGALHVPLDYDMMTVLTRIFSSARL